jgi:transmembrane sensor
MSDELLVKFLLGEASAPEQHQVRSWIALSASNRKYFDDFELIWQQSKIIAQSSQVNEDDAWERFQQRIRKGYKPAPVVPLFRRFHFTAIAAAVLITITAFTVVYLSLFKTPETILLAATNAVVKDTLPDHSVVTLNKNSTLKYAEQEGDQALRKVKLEGEAFFDVAPDKSRPFIIEVDSVTVRVVGTSFNVRNTTDYTEIIVESGVVQVTGNQQQITLTKGESIRVTANGQVAAKQAVRDQLHNYYRTKEFVCDNTPLWKLVEVLNEAYGSNIVIANESLKQYPLTTTFHNEPLDNILLIIHETFDIQIERKGDMILLR